LRFDQVNVKKDLTIKTASLIENTISISKRIFANVSIDLIESNHGRTLYTMNAVNIIWDFDGTILPNTPYDSEQSLIQHKLNMNKPESKVNLLHKMGIPAKTSIAVGDGYTDIPMLDWSRFPIVMDRSGQKRKRFAQKNYDYISSMSELLPLIEKKASFIGDRSGVQGSKF